MSVTCACKKRTARVTLSSPDLSRSGLSFLGSLTSWTLLAITPKCPMCFAAYVAAATGLSLSASGMAAVQTMLVILATGSITYFLVSAARIQRSDAITRRSRQKVFNQEPIGYPRLG